MYVGTIHSLDAKYQRTTTRSYIITSGIMMHDALFLSWAWVAHINKNAWSFLDMNVNYANLVDQRDNVLMVEHIDDFYWLDTFCCRLLFCSSFCVWWESFFAADNMLLFLTNLLKSHVDRSPHQTIHLQSSNLSPLGFVNECVSNSKCQISNVGIKQWSTSLWNFNTYHSFILLFDRFYHQGGTISTSIIPYYFSIKHTPKSMNLNVF